MAYAVPRACVRAAGDSWPLVCLYDSCLTAPAQPRHLFGCGCRTCGHPRIHATCVNHPNVAAAHVCCPPPPTRERLMRCAGRESAAARSPCSLSLLRLVPPPLPHRNPLTQGATHAHTHTHTAATPYKPDPNLDTARAGGCTAAQRQCPWLRPHQLCMRASCASRAGHPALGRRTRPSTNRTCPGVTCMHCDHA